VALNSGQVRVEWEATPSRKKLRSEAGKYEPKANLVAKDMAANERDAGYVKSASAPHRPLPKHDPPPSASNGDAIMK
jgi:hypothetical protein